MIVDIIVDYIEVVGIVNSIETL